MNIEGFRKMTDSLKLYHRITNEKYNDEIDISPKVNALEKIYVDILPNNGVLEKVLERNTTFIQGQRGTGKSTIIAMAQNEIAKKKKDLSIYINAKTIYKSAQLETPTVGDMGDTVFSQDEIFKLVLIEKSMQELCKSMVEELKIEKNNILKMAMEKNKIKKVEQVIKEIEILLNSEKFKSIDKIISSDQNFENKDKIIGEIRSSLTEFGASAGATNEKSTSTSTKSIIARYCNFPQVINKFLEVLDVTKRRAIYIFIDDYSELSIDERSFFMNELLTPMYHLGVDKIFLKIACYPNKLNPINFDTQKYSILSIDYYDIYGVDRNISDTEREAVNYVKRLLNNSCRIFCKSDLEEYFDLSNNTMDDYYMIIHKMCMNIPRAMGHILNTCFLKRINNGKLINTTTLNEASLKYYHDHIEQEMTNKLRTTDVDREMKVNVYVQKKLMQSILALAKRNKIELTKTNNTYFNKFSEVPTSHFRTNSENDIYFEELSFYGYVHKVNEVADKGKKIDGKNINTSLYAIDYGACLEEKIIYGKPDSVDTKYFQQRAFLYDDCIISVLKDNKKLVCNNPNCAAEYSIDKLELFRDFGMHCQKCMPIGICEIKYDNSVLNAVDKTYNDAVWTQQELDILQALYSMEDNNCKMFMANEISGEIDVSSHVIAARCKELISASYILRSGDVSPYRYGLTERSRQILKIN